jgi:hypothetical protein
MSYEMPDLEGGDTFIQEGDAQASSQGMETNAAEADQVPAAEIQPNIPVEVEKRKKRVSIYWKRPKSHLYEYNYGAFVAYPIVQFRV